MLVQIGMRCEPGWLCQSIGVVVGLAVILLLLGLSRVVLREYRKNRRK